MKLYIGFIITFLSSFMCAEIPTYVEMLMFSTFIEYSSYLVW